MISSFNQALQNIFRNKWINFLSLTIISFTLMIFGIFNYLTFSLESFINRFAKETEAIFYLKDNTNNEQVDQLMDRIRDNLLVEDISFTSRNQAQSQFLDQFPDLEYIVNEFDQSPFPASIEVKFKNIQHMTTPLESFIDEITKMTIVESRQVNFEWAKKIITIKQFISVVGIFLSFILIFISIFIIFNVIKLNIFHRQSEISLLRYVGAKDWYIRLPFIIEGALLGFLSSILAGGLLVLSFKMFPIYAGFVYEIVKDMVSFQSIPFIIFIKILILGCAIGILASFFSIRKFLND